MFDLKPRNVITSIATVEVSLGTLITDAPFVEQVFSALGAPEAYLGVLGIYAIGGLWAVVNQIDKSPAPVNVGE